MFIIGNADFELNTSVILSASGNPLFSKVFILRIYIIYILKYTEIYLFSIFILVNLTAYLVYLFWSI